MTAGAWALGMLAAGCLAFQEGPPLSDAELSSRLTVARARIADSAVDPAQREQLAIDTAALFDRAAQEAAEPGAARRRWGQAIEFLDEFSRAQPNLPLSRQLRFEAGVFRWAQARTWMNAAELAPGDDRPRDRAVKALDDAIQRFRVTMVADDRSALAENLRFRLAQALVDRAEAGLEGPEDQKPWRDEAWRLLASPPKEAGLAGFWHLLKADLARRTGRTDEAVQELDLAVHCKPAPSEHDVLEVEVPLRIAQGRFAESLQRVEGSQLAPPAKGLWKVRVLLAELALPAGKKPAAERSRVLDDLFREIGSLRSTESPETRRALVELGTNGPKLDDGVDRPAADWDAMAAAYQARGKLEKAGEAELRAARRAEKSPAGGTAPGEYRLRAGAFLFQAEKYLEADAALSKVADGPGAGPAHDRVRARAGMLRALARGRAVERGLSGASPGSYREALERQVRDFPDDAGTDEARWLLGRVYASAGEADRAREIWSAIAPSARPWLESRLAIAEADRAAIERRLDNADRAELRGPFDRADQFLKTSLRRAPSESVSAALLLARARLNLTPLAGRPETALELCDRAARLPAGPAVEHRARLLRLAALLALGRSTEAEREARLHRDRPVPSEREALRETIRLLDRSAAFTSNDLRQRRYGLVLQLLVRPLLDDRSDKTPAERNELEMRMTRALLYAGEDQAARRSLAAWAGNPDTASDPILRDLGDTYRRLGIPTLNVDVQRLRLKKNPSGSPEWFDARYALALAYYQTGQFQDAAKLIDATAILHPELGGGPLHNKFVRLRQRIGNKF